VVEGVFALLAVGFLHLRDALRHLPEESQISPFAMYGALLVFPGLLLFFHLQERSGGGGSPGASPRSPTSAERDQRPL